MFVSIDLDAFYCGVEEHDDPSLRGEPFCVVQKFCVATVSYPARELGVKKLANINEVKAKFPDMKIVNGEDLSKYRQAGKMIYKWLCNLLGEIPVERLGLEEMRLDVSEIVTIMIDQLPSLVDIQHWMKDPDFMDEVAARGLHFTIPGTYTELDLPNFYFNFEGNTWPPGREKLLEARSLEAYLAGNLASYIRDRMWLELGYSASIGVASSKNYAKMVGSCHKPRGVTVLQPSHEAEFVRSMSAGKVPGLGRASMKILECSGDYTVAQILLNHTETSFNCALSPVIGASASQVLWRLLHGDDIEGHEIRPYTMPNQVSIEDSYGSVCPQSLWFSELKKLCEHLIYQATVEWYDDDAKIWQAVPSNFRLSIILSDGRYLRRSKTIQYTWENNDSPKTVGVGLTELSLQLIHQLTRLHGEQPRVINVALLL